MKLKTLFHMLGFKPRPKVYGYEIEEHELRGEGVVRYARWLHPQESRKQFTQEEVDHLRNFLRPGDVAIDVGAHTGDTTLPMALAVGPTGCVLALEPNPYVGRILDVNANLNRDKATVEPLRFAATPQDGFIEFEYSDPGFCNGGRHEGIHTWRHGHVFKLTVQGRNLENYLRAERADLLDRLRFIKTDAEGFDLTILNTLRGIILERRPYLKAEVYKHTSPEQRFALLSAMWEMGYETRHVASPTNYLGVVIDQNHLMAWRHFDVFGIPREYVGRHELAA